MKKRWVLLDSCNTSLRRPKRRAATSKQSIRVASLYWRFGGWLHVIFHCHLLLILVLAQAALANVFFLYHACVSKNIYENERQINHICILNENWKLYREIDQGFGTHYLWSKMLVLIFNIAKQSVLARLCFLFETRDGIWKRLDQDLCTQSLGL